MKTITGHTEGSTIVLDELLELTPSSRLEITVLPTDAGRLESEARLEQMMSIKTDRLYLSESALPANRPETKVRTPAPQTEHCYTVHKFKGRGWTQELEWLQKDNEKQAQWEGKLFTEFLNDMAKQGWSLVDSTVLVTDYSYNNYVTYFRREV